MLNVPAMQGAAARRRGGAPKWWEAGHAWYPLTSDFADYSGNGRNGTAYGAANISGSPKMLQLDGDGDYVDITGGLPSSPTVFTVAMFAEIARKGVMFAHRSASQTLIQISESATADRYQAQIRASSGNLQILSGDLNVLGLRFLALVVDVPAKIQEFYVDGNLKASQTVDYGAVNFLANITTIGGYTTNNGASYLTFGIRAGSLAIVTERKTQPDIAEMFNSLKAYYGVA